MAQLFSASPYLDAGRSHVRQPVDTFFEIMGGVYAFGDLSHVEHELTAYFMGLAEYRRRREHGFLRWTIGWCPFEETETIVRGTVKMWGDVVEHEHGYRSEFARIDSLDEAWGPQRSALNDLRAKYLPAPKGGTA